MNASRPEGEAMGRKTLVVGDMHLKEELILSRVDAAIEQMGIDRVVFCGDYLDEWNSNDLTMRDAIDCLTSWVKGRRSRGLAVDLVLGNHDMCYLLGIPGPGTHTKMYAEASAALGAINATMATTVGDFLVTHAGVTGAWASEHLEASACASAAAVANALNAMFERGTNEELAALYSAGPARGGTGVPSPLWADLSELYQDPLPGIAQIVGHTPVESIEFWQVPSPNGNYTESKLLFCDTFGLTPQFNPVGDGSMLLVEGSSMRAVTANDLDLDPWPRASWDWMTTAVLPFL